MKKIFILLMITSLFACDKITNDITNNEEVLITYDLQFFPGHLFNGITPTHNTDGGVSKISIVSPKGKVIFNEEKNYYRSFNLISIKGSSGDTINMSIELLEIGGSIHNECWVNGLKVSDIRTTETDTILRFKTILE